MKPSDPAAIQTFIHQHRPLAAEVLLAQAHWWTPAQAQFLEQALALGSVWAAPTDELNSLLRPAD